MNNQDRDQRIEAYLRGELVGIDRQLFEEELQEDPSFLAEFKLQKELFAALGDPKVDLFEEQLLAARTRYQAKQIPPAKTIRWAPLAAAAVVLLAIATWVALRNPFATTSASLEAYYQPYVAPGSYRGASALDASDDLLLGISHYEQHHYPNAIPHLKRVVAQDTTESTLPRLLLGVSYLETQEWQQAYTTLLPLSNDTSHTLQGPALWYFAYAAQQLGESEASIATLHTLSQMAEGQWSTMAREVVEATE